jgi:RimJ/RimL family protein N-acetyltransferase
VSDDTTSNANVLARAFDFVRTERLALRRPNAGDAVAFFQIDGNPQANRFNPDGPAPDLAASEARLNEWLRQWQVDGYGYWTLAVPPDSAVVGFGGVRRIIWRDRTVLNLYYKLQPASWRHGYAVMAMLLNWLAWLSTLHRLTCRIFSSSRELDRTTWPRREPLNELVFSADQTSIPTSMSLASARRVARR